MASEYGNRGLQGPNPRSTSPESGSRAASKGGISSDTLQRYVQGTKFSGISAGYDFVAPRFMVLVNDTKIEDDIANRVRDIHVDFDVDKATEIKLTVNDPDGKVRDHKYFDFGNTVHVWVGYGNQLEYLASGDVVKWTPDYPREGKPTLSIHAYDGSHASMDRQGHKNGSVMKSVKDWQVVFHKITEHMGFAADADMTEEVNSRVQRKGISDYMFVKRLALLNDYYYWVDFDIKTHRWTGHFRDRGKLQREQELMYSFTYNDNDFVSLLDFKLDMGMRGMSTDIEIVSFMPDTKKTEYVSIAETKGQFTDHSPGRGTTDPSERQKKRREPKPGQYIYQRKARENTTYDGLSNSLNKRTLIEDSTFGDLDKKVGPPPKGTTLTFTCFGRRIYVIADKPFKNHKDAAGWAARFMKARLMNFIHGSGHVVGTPSLRPRQVHYLDTKDHFAGRWEFTHCLHKILADGPYEVEFSARRLYEPSDPDSNSYVVPRVPRFLTLDGNYANIPGYIP